MKDWERNAATMDEAERFRQEQLLAQKRKQRDQLLKIRMMGIDQKHNNEDADKEVELAERRLKKQSEKEMAALRARLDEIVESDSIKKKDVMPLICGSTDETFKRRLRALMNKQFFELSKYLGAMYSNVEMDKLKERELLRLKFAEEEANAYQTLSGDALKKRVANLRCERDNGLQQIEDDFNENLRREQDKLRKRLHDKHYKERQKLADEEYAVKEEYINKSLKTPQMADDDFMQHVGQVLLAALKDQYEADRDQLNKDKLAELERMKL